MFNGQVHAEDDQRKSYVMYNVEQNLR